MKRLLICLLVVDVVGCGHGSSPPNDSQAKARYLVADVSPLKNLGAEIKQNEQGEVVEVDLYEISDAGLVHLKGLTKLQVLNLYSNLLREDGTMLSPGAQITDAGLVHLKGLANLKWLAIFESEITDAGLVHLKGLTSLQTLELSGTKITDAGLLHLKGLTKLQKLTLFRIKITDAGLVHLKGMTNLKGLNLFGTKVTDAGVAELQKALPNCYISR
jgi:Leucine-rich repeat (LRR) protein